MAGLSRLCGLLFVAFVMAGVSTIGALALDEEPAAAAWFSEGFQLNAGQSIWHGSYFLTMQTDGNLVLYSSGPGGAVAIWHAGTFNNPGARAIFQSDGNLVVYSAQNIPLWHTQTHGSGDTLVLSADGNMTIFSASSQIRWSTNTSTTPTSGSVPGAASWRSPWADGWFHTYGSIEATYTDRVEWEWRFDGPGGEWRYEPTDLTFTKVSTVNTVTDVMWYVTPNSNMVRDGASGEVNCDIWTSTPGVCDRFRFKINETTANMASHIKNNLVCHELGHTVGFGHGVVESSCMTGGDNSRLGWWEVNAINGRY